MKRWFLGPMVFLATLVFGGWLARLALPPATIEQLVPARPEPVAATKTAMPEPATPAFTPEFTDIPNFDVFFNDVPTGKLVDTLESSSDGIYRASEVVAKTGEMWLGLFTKNGVYELRSVPASVKQLRSVSWPGDERDAKLTFGNSSTPIFAVRNINTLKPGPVTNVYHRPSPAEIERRNFPIPSLEEGYNQDFKLNENWYSLRVSRGTTKDGTAVAILILEHNGENQVVYINNQVVGDKDIIGELLWVGDLDNDGKLDLYIEPYNEKGGFGVDLFLSSLAEPGKLVKWAASFGTAGC